MKYLTHRLSSMFRFVNKRLTICDVLVVLLKAQDRILGILMRDPYLYYNSIKDTPVLGHLNFNCLKLINEVKVGYLDE